MDRALEVRVTPWLTHPIWHESLDGVVTGYRIWQHVSQWGWEQRHEWRFADGSTRMESWIRGASSWSPSAQPVAEDA